MKSKSELKHQLQIEVDTFYLYEVLAEKEEKTELVDIFRQMSKIEKHHASIMLQKLKEVGVPNPQFPNPSWRAKTKVQLAKILGYEFIFSELIREEKSIATSVLNEKQKRNIPITGHEDNHFKILENVQISEGLSGSSVAKMEGRHKSVGGNAIRAAVLGANDGLLSNMSLIMGVAGAMQENKAIVLTGVAGMLAGAISMAMGEWLSVRNSQELYEYQIALEMEELEASPEEELAELALIYQAKGIEKTQARQMAEEVFKDKDQALNTLVKEELGIDASDLQGSAWEAAITSFILFAIGAVIPLIPFLVTSGNQAIIWSIIAGVVGLFLLGAAITLFTNKPVWFSGMRQVLFGLVAAGVTFLIGKWIGISIL